MKHFTCFLIICASAAGCTTFNERATMKRSDENSARATHARILGQPDTKCWEQVNPKDCKVALEAEIVQAKDVGAVCVVRAGDVKIKAANGTTKITWTVAPKGAPPPGIEFEFLHKNHGITLLESQGPTLGDITHGGHGDGTLTPAKRQQYHVVNANMNMGSIPFMPVIVYRENGGDPSLCAAIDPKIVNG
jgi:hypothetical protein